MKKTIWIVAATGALLLLMYGVHRATTPEPVVLTHEQAVERIQELAVRLNAAIENERDLRPILAEAQDIVSDQPSIAAGHKLIGQARVSLGDVEGAYGSFDRALQIDPQDPQLHSLAGSAAMIMGNETAAESHHRLANQQAPDRPGLLLPLADLLIKQGRWEEATPVLLRMGELDMTMHEVNAGLADVYRGRGGEGDMGLAVTQMEKAVAKLRVGDEKLLPMREVYARKLAGLYGQMDEPMEAIRALTGLLPEERWYGPGVSADLAKYYEMNEQPALAGLHYEEAFSRDPTDVDAGVKAAQWYLKAGAKDNARDVVEKLERVAPRNAGVVRVREALSGGG